ncbi:MAG: flavodoxin family protein [Pseudomonadales bacterium]|jgi:multimeric flavodoxin WrbA|tara:strand:- start:634 stop:1095 length:462 start_codon:yes stop_codon:yes gene_type:complete
MTMKNLLIIYHSQSGGTENMAQAVHKGCRQEDDVETRFLRAFDANLDDLLWADGIIFGTPENFGYMSGALKDFFDRTFYPAEPHQINLPYGIFVSSGNDGTGAVREIDRIVKGYPLRKICEPLLIVGGFKQGDQELCLEFGHGIATGLSLGIF